MSHITNCSKCGCAYEESSEETARHPNRLCFKCYDAIGREHFGLPHQQTAEKDRRNDPRN